MQNEITELRNQVRTLKRIVCLVCCLFIFGLIVGCNNRVVTTSDTRQVTLLRQQALVEQIAPGREVVITSVESPPNMVGKWHWHPGF